MTSSLTVRVQNQLARAFGISPEDRRNTVTEILARPHHESTAYWLQLTLSMGIATLGLVLGSTAVVIGAMLVSPLMGPIVELGLALAAGSPLLVLRSASRTLGSVSAVVLGAALLVLMLPFHEVTSEIRARTVPNALDLFIAVLCAFAGVYTTTRGRESQTSTAAGTAIGISLVPPLCAAGYGLGTADATVGVGAGLLFLTNFSAILLVATCAFWVLGYNRVGVSDLERATLDATDAGVTRRLASRLQPAFASSLGPALRLAMPLAILAAVFWPLREALTEVSWEVRVRSELQRIISEIPGDLVESTVIVEHHAVLVRVVIVGEPEDGERIRDLLEDGVLRVAGVEPNVEVVVIPDSASLSAVRASLRLAAAAPPARTRAALPEEIERSALRWPSTAGPLLRLTLESGDGGLIARVVHLGPELGEPGREMLAADLAEAWGHATRLEETSLDAQEHVASTDPAAWLVELATTLALTEGLAGLRVCVLEPLAASAAPPPEPHQPAATGGADAPEAPPDEAIAPGAPDQERFRQVVHALLDGRPDVTLGTGPHYSFVLRDTPCAAPTDAAAVVADPMDTATPEAE